MPHSQFLESLESRRLLSFATLDPTFGVGGVATPVNAGGISASTYPLNDGSSIVRVSGTDFRKLDGRGRIVKSFGGGDGVLTLADAASLVAVDRQSGRVALLVYRAGSPATVIFFSASGVAERQTRYTDASRLSHATRMVFDEAGRLLVGSESIISRFIAPSGALDTTFGMAGSLQLISDPLPAGYPTTYMFNDEQQSSLKLVSVLVRPGGGVTIVRSYQTGEALNGYELGGYLDVRTFDADGQTGPGSRVATVQTGFDNHANSRGGVDAQRLDIVGIATASDGGLTLLARRSQTSTTPGVNGGAATVANYSELQLFHLREGATAFGTPRSLDNVFQILRSTNAGVADAVFVADGDRLYIAANSRVASFSATNLRPFKSFNGSGDQTALQLSARNAVYGIAIAANNRVLLNDGRHIRSLTGGSFGTFDTPPGIAKLMPDGTLDVSGTAERDVVTFTAGTKHRISVSINGHAQLFDRRAVTGIVVHTGDGDDTIDGSGLNDISAGLYILPGHGNDRIIGSDGNDTLDSGAGGRDRFDAGIGDDLAFGLATDDTITSADRGDTLFGSIESPLFT